MNTVRRLLFNFWYLRQPPWDTGISPPELMNFLNTHPAGRALDLGCGTGTNVITMAHNGWQVTGVDFAWQAIRRAHLKMKAAGLRADLRVDDVTRLRGLSGPFDLILDIGCFHSLPPASQSLYLANLKRLLSPTGTFLVYVILKARQEDTGRGITEGDLNAICNTLALIERVEGADRGRPSAWLKFNHE